MKTDLFGNVNGDSWEEICHLLLPIKYKNEKYTKVPAKYGGDLGIEGFTNTGILFQCYCPEENEIETSLYEHQRDKITRDINKLKKNIADIKKLIGDCEIIEWHFFTPDYDNKALISHIRTKETEVKNALMHKISQNFKIHLQTEKNFLEEAPYLLNSHFLLNLTSERPDNDNRILDSDNPIIKKIKSKFQKIDSVKDDDEKLRKIILATFNDYEHGQIEFSKLEKNYPMIYQKICKLKDSLESSIEREVNLNIKPANELLSDVQKKYHNQLEVDLDRKMEQSLINCLVGEAIADWIVRCPIDF